ncbi:MAG TPA: chemotaxis protein CheW [Nitrospirota bacterium]
MAEFDNDVTANVIDVPPEEEMRVCLFSMGEESYAIPVESMAEIIIPQKIFTVPTTPAHVLGVINLRGNIIPIVDIRPLLSAPQSSAAGQIALLKHGAMAIGIIVDSVSEVAGVPVSSVQAIPADSHAEPGRDVSRFLKGIIQREAGVAALLDIERIFDEIKLT